MSCEKKRQEFGNPTKPPAYRRDLEVLIVKYMYVTCHVTGLGNKFSLILSVIVIGSDKDMKNLMVQSLSILSLWTHEIVNVFCKYVFQR